MDINNKITLNGIAINISRRLDRHSSKRCLCAFSKVKSADVQKGNRMDSSGIDQIRRVEVFLGRVNEEELALPTQTIANHRMIDAEVKTIDEDGLYTSNVHLKMTKSIIIGTTTTLYFKICIGKPPKLQSLHEDHYIYYYYGYGRCICGQDNKMDLNENSWGPS